MEGFRLNDLKRWHKGFARKVSDQPAANFVQSSLKVEKDDPLFVWPIPQLSSTALRGGTPLAGVHGRYC